MVVQRDDETAFQASPKDEQAGVPVLFFCLRVGWVDDNLAFFAHADALRANAGNVLQGEVDNAALSRRHGIQAEGLLGLLYALCGDTRGHL